MGKAPNSGHVGSRPGAKVKKEYDGLTLGQKIGAARGGNFDGTESERMAHALLGLWQFHKIHPEWPPIPKGPHEISEPVWEIMLQNLPNFLVASPGARTQAIDHIVFTCLRWLLRAGAEDFEALAKLLRTRPPAINKHGEWMLPMADPETLGAIFAGIAATGNGSFTEADIGPALTEISPAERDKIVATHAAGMNPDTIRKRHAELFGVKRKPGVRRKSG